MSSSPNKNNKTIDSNSVIQQGKLDDKAANSIPSTSSSSEKRPYEEKVDEQIKKMKIDSSMATEKDSTSSSVNVAPPKFVAASTMVEGSADISDEELLASVLEFERQNGIQ